MDERQREEMIRSILRRTSGPPCQRAEALLCDYVDGTLDDVDAELVRLHLGHCQPCQELAIALARMAEDLPALAEIWPGERFLDRVLAATLPWPARLRRRVRLFGEDWVALLRRPRIAWEAAYVGTMILALIFATPFSPLREVPPQALELAQQNPVQTLAAGRVAGMPQAVSGWSQSAWNAGGASLVAFLRSTRDDVVDRLGRAADASRPLWPHTADLGSALLHTDTGQGVAALGSIGGDIRAIWREATTGPEAEAMTDEQMNKESEKVGNENHSGEPL
jgi:hypothetical protein